MSEPSRPPVLHALNCICAACVAARRDYVLARREEQRGRAKAFGESPGVAKPKKAAPGTMVAIARRYGRSA